MFVAGLQCQFWLCPRAIQHHGIARINPVRILDGGFVQAPDFRPAPGFFEKLAGNIPQRIALDHDIFVGRIFLDFQCIGPSAGGQHESGQGDASKRQSGQKFAHGNLWFRPCLIFRKKLLLQGCCCVNGYYRREFSESSLFC